MANSGLELILKATFGGVSKMLTRKKYPTNVKALRMVTEVLREMITGIGDEDDLIKVLDDKALQSKTAKLWVDGVFVPTFLIMVYVKAE